MRNGETIRRIVVSTAWSGSKQSPFRRVQRHLCLADQRLLAAANHRQDNRISTAAAQGVAQA
jgi:hypothetical protein